MKSPDPYDRSVRSINDSENYEFSGESEYSRERSDPYQMVDYMIDHGVEFRGSEEKEEANSDERLGELVAQILRSESPSDASEIDVEVKDGVVSLTGTVNSLQSKHLIELSVENLSGVKDIFNHLRFNSTY